MAGSCHLRSSNSFLTGRMHARRKERPREVVGIPGRQRSCIANENIYVPFAIICWTFGPPRRSLRTLAGPDFTAFLLVPLISTHSPRASARGFIGFLRNYLR